MHQENAKWWTLGAAGLIACPSLFCCVFGIVALAGGGTYSLGSGGGSLPNWAGLPTLCLGILFWALPVGVWFFAKRRAAPDDLSPDVVDIPPQE